MRLFQLLTAGILLFLVIACRPDDDMPLPNDEPVVPNCQPPAYTPDPATLPSRITRVAADGDTLKDVNLFYDVNNRLAEKRFGNGDVFTYFYGDDFNRIPDSIREARATEELRIITYEFSEDCLPVIERYLIPMIDISFQIRIGGTEFSHENREVISSRGQLFLSSDKFNTTYYRNRATGLVDSIIKVSDIDNPFPPRTEKFYYTYTDVENPYVVPQEMSYEDFFASRLNTGSKMVRSFTREVVSSIQTGVFTTEYDYELDGSDRIQTVTVSPGGDRYYFFYP